LLLILDDAAGSEQVRPLLPGTGASLVLVTSRRHLTTLEDARTVSLDTLPPRDAAELLVRLAARPGLDPSESAVAEIIRLCGYLPLAIGMLARQLHHHPAWTRELGHRPSESDALTYLGLVRQATGDPEQAAGNLRRALELYRDLGDRLGEAQALNHLGELLLVSAGAASARAHHEQALEIATSIGAPIDQAHALEGIGRTRLHDGHLDQAAPPLRQALTIYQRFGSPHAPRVEALVRDHDL
jgi:tetratricopeptide (TPR) repeat protein